MSTVTTLKEAFLAVFRGRHRSVEPALNALASNLRGVLCAYTIGSGAPSGGSAGDFYYDTVAQTLYFHTGSTWVQVGGGAEPPPP